MIDVDVGDGEGQDFFSRGILAGCWLLGEYKYKYRWVLS